MLDRLRKRMRSRDPRGGLQSDRYRSADPREIVEEEGTVMSGPGGAPQEGKTVEERRRGSENARTGREPGST
jgi:hypothetical protein